MNEMRAQEDGDYEDHFIFNRSQVFAKLELIQALFGGYEK